MEIKDLVKSFYTDCLTVNKTVNVAEKMGALLADNFQSVNTKETKNKPTLIGQIQFFWKLIPDLKWEPQEILQDGNRVIVRSIFSGTPNGNFMGLPVDGSKSFKAMSIDIHTVENNQITQIYHIEEWADVMGQLK